METSNFSSTNFSKSLKTGLVKAQALQTIGAIHTIIDQMKRMQADRESKSLIHDLRGFMDQAIIGPYEYCLKKQIKLLAEDLLILLPDDKDAQQFQIGVTSVSVSPGSGPEVSIMNFADLLGKLIEKL